MLGFGLAAVFAFIHIATIPCNKKICKRKESMQEFGQQATGPKELK
jgi:uncharacterized membrane protein YccF (DUF307 family)